MHNNITTFISYKVDWRYIKQVFRRKGVREGVIDHVKSLLAADRRRSSLSFTITEPTLSAEMSSD